MFAMIDGVSVRVCVVASLLALTGCVSVARAPAAASNGDARPVGITVDVRTLALDVTRIARGHEDAVAQLRAASDDGNIDILALSGGGAGGAFGAGALVGWTATGERPQFEVVTGVSAGALIAPFAFLGSSWDQQLASALSGAGTSGLLQRRFFDVFFRPSVYRGGPLVAFVENNASDALIEAVARESARGRMLLVATTDLDKETSVIWDLGAIARQNTAASRALFRSVLVASASIPGVFPPVMIASTNEKGTFDEMHVDGGVTVAFFVAPEVAHIVPDVLSSLTGANLYVLMNTQMAVMPETTSARLGSIIARSSATVLTQMSRTQLELAAAFAHDRDMRLLVSEIPIDYPYGGSIDFDRSAMRNLFDYAASCAQRHLLWMALPQTLRRNEEALARSASQPPRRKGDAKGVPCPAEIESMD